jgi:hypothetical protein
MNIIDFEKVTSLDSKFEELVSMKTVALEQTQHNLLPIVCSSRRTISELSPTD